MAANRPARTIKPPSKFLDSDVPIATVNGVPNHMDTTGNVLSGAARKLSRSVSLTRDEAKMKNSPKRRSSSIEASADEETKSAGKLSRQNSVSPAAKVKPQRKSDTEEVLPVNGVALSTEKEHSKSVKINNVMNKVKISPGARKQVVSKSKPIDNPGKVQGRTTAEAVKHSPTKSVKGKTDENVINSNSNSVVDRDASSDNAKSIKRTKAKSSPVKSQDKIEGTGNGVDGNVTVGNPAPLGKKRGKPGPKPKQKLNTKKLKTMLSKAKTPKTTAQRVKRKYANHKSTLPMAESHSKLTAETSNPSSSLSGGENVSNIKEKIQKSVAKKRKALKVVKLSTKPGKGKLGTKSALKFAKGTKPAGLKSVEVGQKTSGDSEQKLSMKRPRLKPGPKAKRIKLSDENELNNQDKKLTEINEKMEVASGSSGRSSSVDKTVRYKLDGSPCLKPGPKPKKLIQECTESDVLKTSHNVTLESTEKNVTAKGKPGPKPKKSVSEGSDATGAGDKSKENVTLKGKKSSEAKEEKAPVSPKSKASPKTKKDIVENSNETARRKPGPKPKKASSEPVQLNSANQESTKNKEGTKAVRKQSENTIDPTSNLQLGKNKPGPKPRKNLSENLETANDVNKQSDGKDESIQPGRSKPGPKPKKTLSDSSPVVGDSPDGALKKKSSGKPKKSLSDNDEVNASIDSSKDKSGPKAQKVATESLEKDTVNREAGKNKPGSKTKKAESESSSEGRALTKSKSGLKTKPVQSNITNSPVGAKPASKSKTLKTDLTNSSPGKAKPGPKPRKALLENKSTKPAPSPGKPNTESPKHPSKKLKKGAKRPASLSTTDRQNSTSDESDTLYSLNEPDRKKFRFDQTDSATSSDSEVVLRKPKPVKTSPSPRKMLLKDSIRPKNIDSETDLKRTDTVPVNQHKSPSKSTPPGVFKKMASITAPGTSQGTQQHHSEVESKLGVYIKDLPTMPVIPNMMPTSPLAASHKTLLKTLNQGKVAASRNRRQPSNSSDEEEGIVERRVSVRQSESAFRYKEIVVKKCPGYTQIWLFTSTKIKNALNPKVFQELREALKNARFDDSKLVMLSGSGSVFCSGIDLHYLMDDDRRMAAKKMTDAMKEFVQAVVSFPKPIVAAVNGAAIGLGVAILPLCDIIYASDKASFSCPYSRLAQTPEGCASHTFPSVMGLAMANELLLGGRKLTAIEAYQIGLVSQVFWPTSMMQEVIPRIQNMASFSSRALEQSKLLLRNSSKTKLDYAVEAECQSLLERWSSTECHRAFRTYLEEEQDLLV